MAVTHPFRDAIEKLEFGLVRSTIAAKAASVFGRERIDALEPSTVFAEVRDELDRVAEYRRLLEKDDVPPLDGIDDCRAALHRASIAGSLVPSLDMLQVLRALVVFRQLSVFFQKREERAELLAGLAGHLFTDKMLEFHIDRVIDEEGGVKDSASRELRQLRRDIIEKTGQLRRKMESILKRVAEDQLVQEELVTLRDGRMVLPVKAEYKRQIQGFIHSSSATGQTVYIEPTETLDLNNEVRDLEFAEQREVAKILTELTDRVRPHVASMLQSLEVYAELDSLGARAKYAESMLASTPVVQLRGPLRIQQARHPLLLLHKKRADVMPLDLSLADPESTIVITGPNAGGKSVAMKCVGLLVLMVQSGIPVPCDEKSEFPMYAGVYVDIGDEQSVENDLSTFSSHVKRLAGIVAAADKSSLVLIDEIGTGTDPSEGSALGAAILETLTTRAAHVIATTHHGMLKAFAHEHPMMTNAAMEFDLQSLEPTYRFRAGLPGSSYAFEITRRHGMEVAIIDRAREILGTRSEALEHLLADVEKKSQDLAQQLRGAEAAERTLHAKVEEYEEKLASLKKEAKTIKQEALEEAKALMRDANAAIEHAVRDIREAQASKEAIKAAKELVATAKDSIAAAMEDERAGKGAAKQSKLMPGDAVRLIENPNQAGVVADVPRDGQVLVAFGSMKMRMDINAVERVESGPAKQRVAVQMQEERPKSEIDVRGMYGDDAIKTIDNYLYEAYTAGFERVDIIHGKGTGALRKRVHEYLRDVRIVDNYRLGEWNEGTSGVTVVFFTKE